MDLRPLLDFTGKTALVTGGSDGIGYGVACAFRDAGAETFVTGTKPQDAYPRDFSGMNFFRLDVSDPDSVEELAAQIGELDALVNCIGTVLYGSQEFEREGFARVLDVNLTGVMHVCTVFKDKLAARRGAIVNLDSVVRTRNARNNPAYTASKAGLMHLNEVLAVKWGKLGVRVNGVGPGMVPTKLTMNQVSEGSEEAFAKRVPAGRYGAPEDIAGAVLFLASPLAAYVTGQSLLVDGGLTLI